jgi:hypothetical protein
MIAGWIAFILCLLVGGVCSYQDRGNLVETIAAVVIAIVIYSALGLGLEAISRSIYAYL